MKPRLYKRGGIWYCYTFCGGTKYVFGFGWTPSDAWADWTYWRDGK